MITKCSKFGDYYYYYYFPHFCRLKTLITYSYFLISPVRKNAASEVLVVELNTISEKGYARPGKEIVQPTIVSYNHTLVVQQQSCLSDHKRNGSNFTVNSCTQLSSHVPCKLLLCCLFNHPSVFLATQ
jgi:hypothetical protein